MNNIRKDAKERIEYVFNDEGLDLPDEEVLERIIHETTRVALLEMKRNLFAIFDPLASVQKDMDTFFGSEPEMQGTRSKIASLLSGIKRWDSQIAAQA